MFTSNNNDDNDDNNNNLQYLKTFYSYLDLCSLRSLLYSSRIFCISASIFDNLKNKLCYSKNKAINKPNKEIKDKRVNNANE